MPQRAECTRHAVGPPRVPHQHRQALPALLHTPGPRTPAGTQPSRAIRTGKANAGDHQARLGRAQAVTMRCFRVPPRTQSTQVSPETSNAQRHKARQDRRGLVKRGRKSGYRRLEKRSGGNVWRPNRWEGSRGGQRSARLTVIPKAGGSPSPPSASLGPGQGLRSSTRTSSAQTSYGIGAAAGRPA